MDTQIIQFKRQFKKYSINDCNFFGAKIIERHIRILDIDKSKDGPVSIQPKDIEEVIKFSKLSKKDQKKYLKNKGLNLNLLKGETNKAS